MGAVEFNPFLPEFVADPYPFYARLRAEDPVHQSPLGLWVLTRYDDVARVLRDPRFGRKGFDELVDARFGTEPGQPGLATSMLFRDPPDHTRLRTLAFPLPVIVIEPAWGRPAGRRPRRSGAPSSASSTSGRGAE